MAAAGAAHGAIAPERACTWSAVRYHLPLPPLCSAHLLQLLAGSWRLGRDGCCVAGGCSWQQGWDGRERRRLSGGARRRQRRPCAAGVVLRSDALPHGCDAPCCVSAGCPTQGLASTRPAPLTRGARPLGGLQVLVQARLELLHLLELRIAGRAHRQGVAARGGAGCERLGAREAAGGTAQHWG